MRALPDPGFAGDDGSADPGLVEALAAYDADPEGRHDATLARLQNARLLVPVVALPARLPEQATEELTGEVTKEVTGEVGHGEQRAAGDKTSDMATVLVQGRDGRTALLAFTGTETLRRWNPQARPVPVPLARAAQAALQDGAAAVVVDLAGPVTFVVDAEDLRELAEGHLLVEVSGRFGWATQAR